MRLDRLATAFERFAIYFSFVVNFILVLVVVVTLALLPKLLPLSKEKVVQPLMGGLNTGLALLDSAVISTTIPVDDEMPIQFILPIEQTTIVTLTEDVHLEIENASIALGWGNYLNAYVQLDLPAGTELPVKLRMDVPVSRTIPVHLQVPVRIPLKETDLHQVVTHFETMLTPYQALIEKLP